MSPKQGYVVTVGADSFQLKSMILLFCVMLYCLQDIHASSQCDSMSNSGSVCVTILNPPRANVSDDESMNLRCTWDTDNFDFLMWTFNNSNTLPRGHADYFNTDGTTNTLIFPGTPRGHGEYRCVVVTRDMQSIREFAPLFIYYFPRITFNETINRENPIIATVMSGDSFSYSCTTTNQDRKQWTDRFKNPIQTSSDNHTIVTTGNTDTLTITTAKFDDAKEYYCYAYVYSLDESSAVIQELHLFRPVIIEGPPVIWCYESSKAVAPGSLVSFVCQVLAYPEPTTISWNGSAARTEVTNVGITNKFHSFRTVVNEWNSTLSFKNYVEVNDSGMYHITAQNIHGESSTTVELQVLHIPGALTHVKVDALSATRVRVSWKELDNKEALDLLYYMVLYGEVDSQREQVNVSADELQVELTLLPITQYYFTVGAVNRRGTGDLSPQATITTNKSVPVAPVSVTVDMSAVTPESAIVTWTPLTEEYTGGFDIVRYIVTYKRADEEWSIATTLNVQADASQVILEELDPMTEYSASVKGVNMLGEGFPTVSRSFTTPELKVPGSPINVIPVNPSLVGVSVCWTPGPNSYHIQSYQISVYQLRNGTQLYKALFVAAGSVDTVQLQKCAQVSGLQTDSCYWFSVAAQNAMGSSNASNISDSRGCTVSGLSSGLEAILREPEVLAPIIIAAVVVVVLVLLCGIGCVVRKRSRKKERGLYELNSLSMQKTGHQQAADERSSLSSSQVDNTAFNPHGTIKQANIHSSHSQQNGQGSLLKVPPASSIHGNAEGLMPSITPDSGIPSLSVWDEMQLGPAAQYDPPQGNLMDNSNESEQPVQWTLGPAHESRDTPPIVDRSVSVDHTDSGVDYGEELSHLDSQVSNPGQCDSEMDFDYTDNVAYWKVAPNPAGGVQKQPVTRVTAWDMGVPERSKWDTELDTGAPQRSLEVTLRQVPNCRDKEFVIFSQPPRGPARSLASTNSLQTSL